MIRPTFRKHERLCGALRIRDVATTGRSVHDRPFKLVGKKVAMNGPAFAQVAFSVPKRNVRLAVHRNRIKRLMREAYRLSKPELAIRLKNNKEHFAWLFIFQGNEEPTLTETRMKISRALHRWLEENG